MKQYLIILSLAAGGIFLAAVAHADRGGHCDADPDGKIGAAFDSAQQQKRIDHLTKKLQLSAEQIVSVRSLQERFAVDMQALAAERRANRKARAELRDSDHYDADAVAQLAQRAGAIVAGMQIAKASHGHQLKQLLTAEQLEKLAAMRDKRKIMRRRGQPDKTRGRSEGHDRHGQ